MCVSTGVNVTYSVVGVQLPLRRMWNHATRLRDMSGLQEEFKTQMVKYDSLGGGGRGGSRGRHHEKDKRSAGSNPPQDDQTRLNIPSTFVNSSLSQLDLNSLDNQKFVFLSRFTSCLLQSYKCATTTQQDFQVEYQPRASPCNKTQPKIYTQGSDQDWTI